MKFNTKPTVCNIKLKTPTFYDILLINNTAQSDASINFDSIVGDGFYYTSNDAYGEDNTRIYYILC